MSAGRARALLSSQHGAAIVIEGGLMALFIWDDSLATGIEAIDNQHKKLVSLVNQLHDAMRERKAKEVIGGLFTELKDYTVYHFATEERAFKDYGYAAAAEHASSHKRLIDSLDELAQKEARGELAVSVDTLTFLIDWVKTHIMKEDKLYVPTLKGKHIA